MMKIRGVVSWVTLEKCQKQGSIRDIYLELLSLCHWASPSEEASLCSTCSAACQPKDRKQPPMVTQLHFLLPVFKMLRTLNMRNKDLPVVFRYAEQKCWWYLSITVWVYLTVRVEAVAGVPTPGAWTADLSRAGLIGVVLLLFLRGPQGAQSWGQEITLQRKEGGKWGEGERSSAGSISDKCDVKYSRPWVRRLLVSSSSQHCIENIPCHLWLVGTPLKL